MTDATILMMVRLGVGAITTLFAILLWARTRDSAWMLIIIGVVVYYGGTVFQALELFGMARINLPIEVLNISARALMENLPMLFISIGLLVMLNRKT
ncbi:hypothetical protein [Salinispira pacifica]|uniref:Uncharacterized protein n=1 Tax=Salinispira pacifica TaxID=1307761 RepID=V5WCU8_9SPIO|nr:hypothetical protein [Salinispira pacifica]AHC13607.1 hypothetical protein L21SP2_0163 [Salinispira pacifica]